ncbi:hypothetical protein DAPPUDRAFT_115350 [Daphnia pulex]|uniref:Uncharacterized protein n=1 Tax=Daphnia pulex TaxID=6669 RepID=E9HL30_DAPPU|nr:hypothetical protein DAPPUDRAFT_115350 [Daphnia pulex]|eukprot:EFX67531.1 hypothetical protein DAPPUDRAFT_115350 [Daphnia pulex]
MANESNRESNGNHAPRNSSAGGAYLRRPVSLRLYCRNKKFEEPSIVELKDFIQKARSQGGSWFRNTNKISHSEAMNNHLAALEEDPDCRAESVVLTSTIKSFASVLSSDFKAFQFSFSITIFKYKNTALLLC